MFFLIICTSIFHFNIIDSSLIIIIDVEKQFMVQVKVLYRPYNSCKSNTAKYIQIMKKL